MVAAVTGLGCLACGGGLPQLQPAKTLPLGAYEVAVGASGELGLGEEEPAQPTQGAATEADLELLERSLVQALEAPGVAPWLLARIGLPEGNEASLAYSGRHLRLGVRHAFAYGSWALSVGGGASAVFYQTDEAPGPWRATGLGADVPLSFGWQSRAEVVAVWVGVCAAAEQIRGHISAPSPSRREQAEVSGTRLTGASFLGFSVGVHPIRVRAELSATFVSAAGELEGPAREKLKVASQGLSLTPAGSFAVQF